MKLAPKLESMGQSRHAVDVHIEELVLHGFAAGDRHRIASAVEGELARLLGEGATPRWRQNPPALDRIDAGVFKVNAGAKPQAAGTQIAQAVYQSLRRNARASARAPQTQRGGGGRQP